ncbi:hypothetical protein MTR67_040589 [Solanum verrucosum]|uniref:Ubiquitin-like protease family profile domain-containing protein n=1 Tax=Solanum verrucosum TaxID=315347 RepID=A0AAF0UL25_SOLVR|nr:hypothetical protein MTR67_040589 [Solanum verrucosum]
MQSQISGSIVAMEIEKKSKFLNSPIKLDLNDELVSTFIYSGEKKSSSILRIQFDLVESSRYNEYLWGKDVFSKLVKSITKKMDAKKKYYRIDDWSIGGPETAEYIMKFLMEGMFGDNDNSLKYKNIQPSLKEIAFYQLPSKSDAIPENTFQNVGDKDDDENDDFTSKPPSHKPHNKEKGKQKVTVSLSTSIKKFNMHAGSSCKEKSPPVLHGYRKAKSTPFSSVSTPVENNVPVQELHNQPNDSANTTPPMSSKQPQDTKTCEIGVLRQDLASFKDSDQTFRFVLEEHVKDNVQENYQPAQIHIQDPLSVHEQSNGKQPVGMPSFETGDINALQNDGIQQPQSQFELLDVLLPSLDTINPKKCVVVHPEGVVYDSIPVPVQRTKRPDRWNSFSTRQILDHHLSKIDEIYATYAKVGSEICVAYVESDIRDYINGYRLMAAIPWNTIDHVFIPVNVKQKNHWVLAVLSIVERHIYVYDSYRAADDTQDHDIAYDVTYVEDIPQQGSGDLDCGIYLLAFAEYLSEGEDIPVQYLDSKLHRIGYGALLWQYAAKKMEEGAVSENEALPRMMRPPARIDNSQLVRID